MADRLRLDNTPSWQGGEHGQIVSSVVEIRYRGRTVRGPVFPLAGHPDNCVTVHLGYGRTRAGHVGTGAGFNANAIRTSDALWSGGGGEIVATGETFSLACTQYHHLMEGRGMVRAVTRDEYAEQSEIGARRLRGAGAHHHAVPRAQVRGLQVGHVDRRQRLHRLQRVRRRLPGGKQHSDHRQGPGAARPRDALDPHRQLLPRIGRAARNLFSAGAVHALRERAVRAGLPGRRHRAQRRRPERHGLQPLRRDALLLEQLSLQGPALQLPALSGLEHAEPEAAAQSGRSGAQPRRHGKVHLLRAAHQRRQDRGGERGPAGWRRRDQDRLPAGVPGRRDHLRRPQRPEEPRRAAAGRDAHATRSSPTSTRGRGRPTWRRCGT